MWSHALEAGRNGNGVPEPSSNNRETFIQLETPSHTMTKAFAPTGLLSAGLQDKQDRSAKRQEELARESGASLINVPNKPPPPQTGLLGAITAHERDRKREGGVGAALTERERQKRVAEERQRQFDEQQRQALEQMAQGGGGMFGQPFPGYNPMMANPMMMGMNPMMTMNPMMAPPMGFPGMMNPQHMFAAQQAAQAYQQAMMAFSVAGSQAGGDPAAQGQALTPMMTGPNVPMFDPRMSMMGMPMMAPPMMGMPMQMTGQGMPFDARFSPPMFDANLGPLGGPPAHFSSRNSSANGRGSPLALPVETTEPLTRMSRQNSPAPKS
jgi:CCR4-NOT transcriptional complex subunit CAF120